MKICFPVQSNEGMDSVVHGHFGSAPLFMLFDSETEEVSEVINRDLHHAHGACKPLKALSGATVDAIVVGGIGGGALMGLNRAGLKVYMANGKTVAENLSLINANKLTEVGSAQVCGGHGHGNNNGQHGNRHGCAH